MTEETLRRRISITFDNGPTKGVTERVLDVLARRQIQATFFPVAERIDSAWARDILARARSEGHRVGNHSLTHRAPMGDLSEAETIYEIAGAQSILGELASPGRLIRPWGTEGVLCQKCLNRPAVDYLQREKYTCVLWNSVPRDWERPVEWVRYALADVDRMEETLVVVHDLPTGAMDVLDTFIAELRARNVEFTAEYPDSCVPIHEGSLRFGQDALTTLFCD